MLSTIENMVPMVLVNILGGLITTAVFAAVILVFDWRIGLISLTGILLYLLEVSAMEKKSAVIADDTQKSQTAILLCIGGKMTLPNALMTVVMSFLVFNQIKAFGMGVSMIRLTAAAIDRTVETEDMPRMDENGKAISPAKHDIVFTT